jgi:Na+-driven multidrug efflux pump
MDRTKENQRETGLAQNAAFIHGAYRKAVITGMLSILSVNINVFVDGILVGTRLGPEALAAINLSLPVYLAMCVLGSFLAAGTEIPAARAMGTGDTGSRDLYFRTGLNVSVLASAAVTATPAQNGAEIGITVTAPNGTVKNVVNGQAAALATGANVIAVTVKNGNAVKVYTVTVTRASS